MAARLFGCPETPAFLRVETHTKNAGKNEFGRGEITEKGDLPTLKPGFPGTGKANEGDSPSSKSHQGQGSPLALHLEKPPFAVVPRQETVFLH